MDYNRLILDLYRLTQVVAPPDFSEAALELVKQAVPFDSALWGTFSRTPDGPRPHTGHSHRLAPQMLEEYERVKHLDILHERLVAHPGTTANMDLAAAAGSAHPDVIAHARKWGMEHTLATVVHESPLNLFTLVSLYRSDSSRPYSESQRRLKQDLMPHLVAGWHMNAIHFLSTQSGPGGTLPRACALIDRVGVIYNAEPGLADLLRREVPGWQGPVVPAPLLSLLEDEPHEYRGDAVVVSLLRTLENGTHLISVRPLAPVDELSRRELAVAREFAGGKTHKEIAELFGTSPATVRSQIQSVYAKLGIGTKVELLRQIEDAS